MKDLEICQADKVSSTDLCYGSFAADPDFFKLFDANESSFFSVFENLQQDSASDYYRPLVVRDGDSLLGFLYAYPFSEIFSRQMNSLRRFIGLSSNPRNLRPALSSLASSKGIIEDLDSYYLARIYVMPEARGLGVGDLLLQAFESEAHARGFPRLSLHVRLENAIAQRFYVRSGFTFLDQSTNGYFSMEKIIS